MDSDVDMGTLPIYDSFQSEIFVSDIRITNVDVGCRISLTSRSISMPTYVYINMLPFQTENGKRKPTRFSSIRLLLAPRAIEVCPSTMKGKR
jgi:hypothetical protein